MNRLTEAEEIDRRLAGHGNIVNGNGKVLWWLMGVLAFIVSSVAVASWMSVENKVDELGKQMSAMDAKLQLLLDGRIRDPNAKP